MRLRQILPAEPAAEGHRRGADVPALFPSLRAVIDDRRSEKGRFVITGSSSPALRRSISESLAGRIGVIELAPFSREEITQRWGTIVSWSVCSIAPRSSRPVVSGILG